MDDLARRAFARWTEALPAVTAYVRALVAERNERDDVLQEVALAVFDSYARYDESRPFLPWALAIARRTVSDVLRRRARGPALLGDAAAEALAQAVTEVTESERARLAHLDECLRALAGRAREVCELRYVHGWKPARIGAHLNLRANTAAKILQRVREELRDCVESRVRREGTA